jgi:hypothetical protein
MKHKQMKSPFTGGAVQSVLERQTVPFKHETFQMDVETLVCVDTGRRFTTGVMDDAFVDQLHRLWRERHQMIAFRYPNPTYRQ